MKPAEARAVLDVLWQVHLQITSSPYVGPGSKEERTRIVYYQDALVPQWQAELRKAIEILSREANAEEKPHQTATIGEIEATT